jgi:molybdopterin-biosynthesis enzyme MoeA-like protein
MLDEIRPTLTGNAPVISATIEAGAIPEGNFAGGLAEIAAAHGSVSIGSYPSLTPDGFSNRIVVRGRDAQAVAAARAAVEDLLSGLRT